MDDTLQQILRYIFERDLRVLQLEQENQQLRDENDVLKGTHLKPSSPPQSPVEGE